MEETKSISQKINTKRAILERMLISLPHGVSFDGCYPHRGELPTSLYRYPWKRANTRKLTLGDVEDYLRELSSDCNQTQIGYEVFTAVCTNETSKVAVEFIPSSNPSSQESIDDDVLLQMSEYDSPCDDFTLYKLPSLKCDVDICQMEDGRILDEPLELQDLRCYARNMPNVGDLLSRLSSRTVEDPFVKSSGEKFTERELCLAPFSDGNQLYASAPTDPTETFDVIPITDSQIGLLDEVFVPSSPAEESSALRQHRAQCDAIIQEITNEYQTESFLCEEMVEEFTNNISAAGQCMQLERASDVTSPLDVADELQLLDCAPPHGDNGDDDVRMRWVADQYLLELPMFSVTRAEDSSYAAPWRDEQLMPMSPGSVDRDFMTSEKRLEIEKSMQRHERLFDDVIAMLLPEPALEKWSASSLASTAALVTSLSLGRAEISSELELELTWDPVADSTKSIKHCVSTEACSYRRLELQHSNAFEDFELLQIHTDSAEEVIAGVDGVTGGCAMPTLKQMNILRETQRKYVDTSSKSKKRKSLESNAAGDRKQPGGLPLRNGAIQVGGAMAGGMMTNGMVTGGVMSSFGSDPLSDFIMLRNEKRLIEASAQPDIRQQANSGKATGATLPSAAGSSETTSPAATKKASSSIVVVALSGEFRQLLASVRRVAQPLMTSLKSRSLLSRSQRFSTLTSDVTRFLVKQQEKTQLNSTQTDNAAHEALLCLHVLVSVADALLRLCLRSALILLTSLVDKHQLQDVGALKKLHASMLQAHAAHQEKHELHPKLTELCRRVSGWLSGGGSGGGGSEGVQAATAVGHVLVVCNQESLSEYVHETLATVQRVRPVRLSVPVPHSQLLSSLKVHNCLVWTGQYLPDDLPLHVFTTVVEYDHSFNQQVKDSCERANVNYVGMECMMPSDDDVDLQVAADRAESGAHVTDKEHASDDVMREASPDNDEYVVICSQRVTKRCNLLRLLESRENLSVIERDYSALLKQQPRLPFADVIIDERSGVVIESMRSLCDDGAADALVQRVTCLTLQYSSMWFIVEQADDANRSYCYTGSFVLNVTKLEAAFAALQDTCAVKMLYSYSDATTAQLIKQLLSVCSRRHSAATSRDAWLKRDWLNPEFLQHERQLLLDYPCFNSFSAQLLLGCGEWSSVLAAGYERLAKLCPRLPPRTLQMFCQMKRKHERPEVAGEQVTTQRVDRDVTVHKLDAEQGAKSPDNALNDVSFTMISPEFPVKDQSLEETDVRLAAAAAGKSDARRVPDIDHLEKRYERSAEAAVAAGGSCEPDTDSLPFSQSAGPNQYEVAALQSYPSEIAALDEPADNEEGMAADDADVTFSPRSYTPAVQCLPRIAADASPFAASLPRDVKPRSVTPIARPISGEDFDDYQMSPLQYIQKNCDAMTAPRSRDGYRPRRQWPSTVTSLSDDDDVTGSYTAPKLPFADELQQKRGYTTSHVVRRGDARDSAGNISGFPQSLRARRLDDGDGGTSRRDKTALQQLIENQELTLDKLRARQMTADATVRHDGGSRLSRRHDAASDEHEQQQQQLDYHKRRIAAKVDERATTVKQANQRAAPAAAAMVPSLSLKQANQRVALAAAAMVPSLSRKQLSLSRGQTQKLPQQQLWSEIGHARTRFSTSGGMGQFAEHNGSRREAEVNSKQRQQRLSGQMTSSAAGQCWTRRMPQADFLTPRKSHGVVEQSAAERLLCLSGGKLSRRVTRPAPDKPVTGLVESSSISSRDVDSAPLKQTVAAVTPRVRQQHVTSHRKLHIPSEDVQLTTAVGQQRLADVTPDFTRQRVARFERVNDVESPPIDFDSEDDAIMGTTTPAYDRPSHRDDIDRRHDVIGRRPKTPGSAVFTRDSHDSVVNHGRRDGVDVTSRGKRRKLTYERIPGKTGQTKLSFVRE